MKIYHDLEQGSAEWLALRTRNFCASELGPFALEPIKVTLTVPQLTAVLDGHGIPRKGLTKRDDLLELLPNPQDFATLCDGAETAIIKKIVEGAKKDEWQIAMDEKKAAQFDRMIQIQRGNALEPFARAYYRDVTGYEVAEVGFIEADGDGLPGMGMGGYGCSPDGLIYTPTPDHCLMTGGPNPVHGLEIKCPMPETHLSWLRGWHKKRVFPADHWYQCHAGMAVTGLDRWDFLSYCPGDAQLLIEVHRDDFTNKLEAGLKTLVSEMGKMRAEFAELAAKEEGRVK